MPDLSYFSKKRDMIEQIDNNNQIVPNESTLPRLISPKLVEETGEAVYEYFNSGNTARILCSTSIASVVVENGINCPGNLSVDQTCNRCITSENIQKCDIKTGK
jgi:hypothetical protein